MYQSTLSLLWHLLPYNQTGWGLTEYGKTQENNYQGDLNVDAKIWGHLVYNIPSKCLHKNSQQFTEVWDKMGSLWSNINLTCISIMDCLYQHWQLRHWGLIKMAATFQTILSNAFSSLKMFEFLLQFHRNSFLRSQLIINQHWFRPVYPPPTSLGGGIIMAWHWPGDMPLPELMMM